MQRINHNSKNPIVNIISQVISWTVLILLALIALLLMYYIVSAKLYESNGNKYRPAMSLFTIISSSMEPNIKVYDVVFDVKVKDPSDIEVGDVITFVSTSSLSEGLTITHRVAAKIDTAEGVKFRTKGDANVTSDSSLVSMDNVIGKVIFKIPQLGRVQSLLQSKGGWLIFLLLPAIAMVVYDVIKVLRLSQAEHRINDALSKNEVFVKDTRELKNKLEKKYDIKDSIPTPIVNKNDSNIDSIKIMKNIEEYQDNDIELPKIKKD